MTNSWTCPLCGRNKFTRKYQPHNCNHGFRKKGFSKITKFELREFIAGKKFQFGLNSFDKDN